MIFFTTCRFAGSIMKPLVVDQYNHYMLGVDRLDQRMSYYKFVRKSFRWWQKVFFWMVEVVVVNSYIVYNAHTDSRRKLTHKEFRRELVLALCREQKTTSTHRLPQSLEQCLLLVYAGLFLCCGEKKPLHNCSLCLYDRDYL